MTDLHPIYAGPGIHKTRNVSPYDVLRRIKAEMPLASMKETFQPFAEVIKDDEELLNAVIEYFHTNAWNSIEGISRRRIAASQTPEEKEKQEQKIKEAVQKVKAAVIMDFLMPNGKTVRDCTFGYLQQIGGKFTKLGKAGKSKNVVGKTLTTKQVQDIWNS